MSILHLHHIEKIKKPERQARSTHFIQRLLKSLFFDQNTLIWTKKPTDKMFCLLSCEHKHLKCQLFQWLHKERNDKKYLPSSLFIEDMSSVCVKLPRGKLPETQSLRKGKGKCRSDLSSYRESSLCYTQVQPFFLIILYSETPISQIKFPKRVAKTENSLSFRC